MRVFCLEFGFEMGWSMLLFGFELGCDQGDAKILLIVVNQTTK